MRLGDMVIRGGSVHMLVALSISITIPMSTIASIGRFSLPLANDIAIVGSMDVAPISVAAIAIARLCFPLSIAMMPSIVAPMMGVMDVEAILVVGRCRVESIATMSISTMSIATMSIATMSIA